MKGIILAAGRGSRLGDTTQVVPKPLVPVQGRACIDFAIEALAAVCNEVIVVTGYRAGDIEDHIATRPVAESARHVPIRTVRNPDLEAGNLTSLGAARPLVEGDAFILTNADHLFPAEMYTRHFPPTATGIHVAGENDRPILDDEMKVIELGGALQAISKTLPTFDGAYIGTTMVAADTIAAYWAAFDRVHATRDLASASVEMVLGELAASADAIPQVHWITGLKWFEVDTPEDLAIARESLGV